MGQALWSTQDMLAKRVSNGGTPPWSLPASVVGRGSPTRPLAAAATSPQALWSNNAHVAGHYFRCRDVQQQSTISQNVRVTAPELVRHIRFGAPETEGCGDGTCMSAR